MNQVERLDKVLSNMGYGSRRDVKKYIRDGYVEVNGEVITKNGVRVKPYKDDIYFNGERVEYREYIYLMMNKPQGYVSSTDDPLSPTVLELIDFEYLNFEPFPAGRLDKDTEGLLLITNDGKLAHSLLSPRRRVDKTYFAVIEGTVTEDHVEEFKEGVVLDDGYKTLPADLDILATGTLSEIELTIQEGKYHQVKRMFKSIGLEVVYLKRIRMGTLELDDDLELGEFRELTDEELKSLEEI